MDEIWKMILPAVLTGVPGYVALYLAYRKHPVETRKISAEAREANGNAAESFAQAASLTAKENTELREEVGKLKKALEGLGRTVRQMGERVSCLEKMLERCARRITYLMVGIEMLIKQVTNLHAEPVWRPDDWDMYVDEPAKPEDEEER